MNVYNLISYSWIKIWNRFRGVHATNVSKWTLKTLIFRFFLFLTFFPDLRHLQFKNVKLNFKFIILDLKLAQKPNFSQLSWKLLTIYFFQGRPTFFRFWKLQLAVFEQSFWKIPDSDSLGRYGLRYQISWI